MTPTLAQICAHLDDLLDVRTIPDYPNAVNGLQVEHRGPVTGIATAVDVSAQTIAGTVDAGANFLIVHHGLFWGGLQPFTGHRYSRLHALLTHDIALYSAHLPLDAHAIHGNSRLLARALLFEPSDGFAHFQGVACGVWGESDVATADLVARVDQFARRHGSTTRTSSFAAARRTRRWAICSGAGAGTSTLDEAASLGIDTLIVGEGPHWTAVDAPERGIVIVYAGHYATETLGVTALGQHLAGAFGLPHRFIAAPTGL